MVEAVAFGAATGLWFWSRLRSRPWHHDNWILPSGTSTSIPLKAGLASPSPPFTKATLSSLVTFGALHFPRPAVTANVDLIWQAGDDFPNALAVAVYEAALTLNFVDETLLTIPVVAGRAVWSKKHAFVPALFIISRTLKLLDASRAFTMETGRALDENSHAAAVSSLVTVGTFVLGNAPEA